MPTTFAKARAQAPGAIHPTLVWNEATAAFARQELQWRVYGRIPRLDLQLDGISLSPLRAEINVKHWRLTKPVRGQPLGLFDKLKASRRLGEALREMARARNQGAGQ